MTTSNGAKADQPLYTMASTFMHLPRCEDVFTSDADIVISGVPFDMATSGRSGTRFGPQGIRLASANLVWEDVRWPWQFALQDHLKAVDCGDLYFKHGEPHTLAENLEAHADTILEAGKSLLTFGGDHFIALPLLRAHAKKYGPVALIHFDAHTDTYSNGSQYDHGTMFYHGVNEGLIDTDHSLQIGIRTTYTADNHPFKVLDAAWVNDHGPQAVIDAIRETVGQRPAYITFDIDCLDPAYAPGTGTPVAGGLTTDWALKIIRGLTGLNLLGMDLVEVAPAYDHADVTSLAGATLALEYLYVQAANKWATR